MKNSGLNFLIYVLFKNKKAKLKKKIMVQTFNPHNFSFFFSAIRKLYNIVLNKLNLVIYNKIIKLLLKILHSLDTDVFFMGSLFYYFKITGCKYGDLLNLVRENDSLIVNSTRSDILPNTFKDVLSLLMLFSIINQLSTSLSDNSIVRVPTKKTKYTVLRSPHTDKKSREQFALTEFKQIINFSSRMNNDIINILIKYFEFYTKVSYKTYSSY